MNRIKCIEYNAKDIQQDGLLRRNLVIFKIQSNDRTVVSWLTDYLIIGKPHTKSSQMNRNVPNKPKLNFDSVKYIEVLFSSIFSCETAHVRLHNMYVGEISSEGEFDHYSNLF